jgi:hypothetical protein
LLSQIKENDMGFPKKKRYEHGSPGRERELHDVTLTRIKKSIRASDNPTAARRDFVAKKLLGQRS